MAAGTMARTADDEWESVWRDYDRRAPVPVAAPARPAAPKPKAQRPKPVLLLVLAFGLALAPRLTSLHSATAYGAELPPLSTSIARLATHSADAACWVLQLDPRRLACP
jgi:hypothetical protein